MQWDLLIQNALVIDGTGAKPRQFDVAVKDGRIAAMGNDLKSSDAHESVDGTGRWLLPGLWDIHTHLDLEVELDPGLTEVVRHGSTSVVVANCSIGVAFGRQNADGHDPVVSCFARVENMPKPVLQRVADKITWDNTGDYLKHFSQIPLGANIVPMIPHSMLRIEAMGLENSVSRAPTAAEMTRMETLLDTAMKQGYPGFSTDALPFHYLSNDPHKQYKIPTHYSSYNELKQLTNVVRKHDRVWQATPPKDSPPKVFKTFLLTSGRLFGKPLKLTAVAALDVITNRNLARMGRVLTRVLNSKLLQGRFYLQALAAPFRVYADGILTPIAEEIPAMRELNEIDHEDSEGRLKLLNDPAFIQRFRGMWYYDKQGFSLARLKRYLNIMDDSLSRDLADMVMTERPIAVWKDQTLQQIYQRLKDWQVTGSGARNDEETECFESFPKPIADDCDFFLHLLRRYDTKLRWYALVANDNEARMKEVLFDPQVMPGFNDSGAHISNMAYYDGNLRGLQLAQKDSLEKVAYQVQRLTQMPAEFWGIDGVGAIELGNQADLILVDPDALASYQSEANTIFEHRDALGAEQMLNRSDGVVTDVWIAGKPAWHESAASELLGQQTLGRVLTVESGGLDKPQRVDLAAAA